VLGNYLRRNETLSQRQMAKKMGVNAGVINSICAGMIYKTAWREHVRIQK